MKKFRITFSDGPTGNRSESVDVEAEDSDVAFSMAYRMPQAKDRRYTDVMVEECPTGYARRHSRDT